jgi:hypothetical protein
MEILDVANLLAELKKDMNARFDKIETKLDEKVSDSQCKERMSGSKLVVTNKQITAIIGAISAICVAIVAALK